MVMECKTIYLSDILLWRKCEVFWGSLSKITKMYIVFVYSLYLSDDYKLIH